MFARVGYADATAEAIAREAGMSKATFYEHFGNKEECILALFDAAIDVVLEARCAQAARGARRREPAGRASRAAVRAFLDVARRLPRRGADAAGRDHRRRPARDASAATPRSTRVADYIDEANRADAEARRRSTASPRRSTRSRSSARSSSSPRASCAPAIPSDIRELEPVLERLILGIVGAIPPRPSAV